MGNALAGLLGFYNPSRGSCVEDEAKLALWGFLGLAVLSAVAVAGNFFRPDDWIVSATCMLIGMALCVRNRRRIFSWINIPDAAILAVLLFYVSLVPMTPFECYDTDLYHLQVIKWVNQNPLPLGLANLHGRFGFNSSWFPLAALVELPALLAHSPNFLSNAIAMFFCGSAIFLATRRCFSNELSLSRLFLALTAIPWAIKTPNYMNSPSPDLPVMFLTFFIIYLITDSWERGRTRVVGLEIAAVLSAFALTLKLSVVPLLPSIFILSLAQYYGKNRMAESQAGGLKPRRSLYWPFSARSTAMICLLIVLWAAKGICLSGCAAFPATVACLKQFKWTVSEQNAKSARDWVLGWAREPGPKAVESLSDWKWFRPWLKKHVAREKVLLSLLFCGIVLVGMGRPRNRSAPWISPIAIPAFICLIGIAFWFMTAPDPRFGYGFLFSFVLLIFCQGVLSVSRFNTFFDRLARHGKRTWLIALGCGCFLLGMLTTDNIAGGFLWGLLAVVGGIILSRYASIKNVAFWVALGVLLISAQPFQRSLNVENWNQWSSFRPVELNVKKTDSGLSLYVPEHEALCGDAPLPCAAYFDPKLKAEKSEDGKFLMFWISEQ